MRSNTLFLMLALVLLAVSPARASSLFLDNGSTASLGVGDTIDFVVLIETAHVDIGTGAVLGSVTLLDNSTASWIGGDVSTIEVFNQGVMTIGVDPLAPVPQVDGIDAPPTITSAECPACLLTGTLADGSLEAVGASVLQGGQIVINPVPEPGIAAMLAFGLLGLGLIPTSLFRNH